MSKIEETFSQSGQKAPSRAGVWRMFDRIAPRYDFLNRLLSLRRDVAWRKKIVRYFPNRAQLSLLDIATGTGDVIFSSLKKDPRVTEAVGVDMAPEMLRLAQEKAERRETRGRVFFLRCDGHVLPFHDDSFDAVTIAFGIRNMHDVPAALAEMQRVLTEGGKAVILEFSLPHSKFFRRLYLFYFRYLLPTLGAVISGDNRAYRYLNETVETFPYGEAFCTLMEKAGFHNVGAVPLTFGIATIYHGEKIGGNSLEFREGEGT